MMLLRRLGECCMPCAANSFDVGATVERRWSMSRGHTCNQMVLRQQGPVQVQVLPLAYQPLSSCCCHWLDGALIMQTAQAKSCCECRCWHWQICPRQAAIDC